MASNAEVIRHEGTGSGPVLEHGVSQSDAAGVEVSRQAELGTQQLEAQARAVIQARFYMANQPNMQRNWDHVEQKLRKECMRPGFANSAWWVLPLGGDPKKYPEGLSIRFAEAALRLARNIDVQTQAVYDDAWKRIVRITVLDLEANFAYTMEATIDKTVERSNPKDREVLSYRQNSNGKMTYIIAATEQEIALKQGSAVSKAIRTNGLRLIPGDILDECKQIIKATRAKGAQAEDPEHARKTLLDCFAEVAVLPADLAQYLEHDTAVFQPAERELLRGIYTAIKNGVCTWREVMEAKFGAAENAKESEGAAKLKNILEKRKAGTATAATQEQPQPTPSTAAPAASGPPDNLTDHADWPETMQDLWCKVKGKVYRLDDQSGNYKPWEQPGETGAARTKPARREMDFGGGTAK